MAFKPHFNCKFIIASFLSLCFLHPAYARDIFSPNDTSSVHLTSALVPIHYAKAKTLEKFIADPKLKLLSSNGHVKSDDRTNSLWIQDDFSHLQEIKTIIKQLDTPLKQILIKARIVNVDDQSLQSLGIDFSTRTTDNSSNTSLKMDLPASSGIDHARIPIANLGDGSILDLQLSALEQEGHAQIISMPELMTTNKQSATIQSGEEIPYQEQTRNGGTSVTFKKALLKLKVTPEILPNKKILLHLTVNQDKISSLNVQGAPAIRTQQLQTQVLLANKHTIVLGGIYEQINNQSESGIPLLRKIPILGALFREQNKKHERKELLIFVTPQIIYPSPIKRRTLDI